MKIQLKYHFGLVLLIFIMISRILMFYIEPFPGHDGIWTLTPVFSKLNGSWGEDIYTGYQLPFLHYYLKLPFYYLIGNNIFGPFILNTLINILLIIFCYIQFKEKHSTGGIFLLLALFLSHRCFNSMRPEHLLGLLLFIYFVSFHFIQQKHKHFFIILLFFLMHPAMGIFGLLFFYYQNFQQPIIQSITFFIPYLLIGILIIFLEPDLSNDLFLSLQARLQGNIFVPFLFYIKSSLFIIIYYIFSLFYIPNKKSLNFLFVLILTCIVLGKDYYFDYIIYFLLFECLNSTIYFNKNVKVITYFAIVFVGFRNLYGSTLHPKNNYKEIINRTEEIINQTHANFQLPMEFGMAGFKSTHTRFMYHNQETKQYTYLVKNTQEYQKILIYKNTEKNLYSNLTTSKSKFTIEIAAKNNEEYNLVWVKE